MKYAAVCALLMAASLAAQPVPSAVVNAASNILPNRPNAAIARGALFVVYGTNLGPVSIVQASLPFPPILGGTSIRVAVNGVAAEAPMFYALTTQLAAVLPSSIPAGSGTLTITYNGLAGDPLPVTVIDSNPGIFTVNQQGTGDAIATFTDYSLITERSAARAGETVILWATGLGPVNFDETIPAGTAAADMANIPLVVYVGGKPAKVTYRGRSACCIALDQINIELPLGVAGCLTPVTLVVRNMPGNTVTLPIASTGRTCDSNNPIMSKSEYDSWAAKAALTTGMAYFTRNIDVVNSTRSDEATILFSRPLGTSPFSLGNASSMRPSGSCTAGSIRAGGAAGGRALDAGDSISVSGPAGNRVVPNRDGSPFYNAHLGEGIPGDYLDNGQYTITGPGGSSIGQFQVNMNIQGVVWTNHASLARINRANGATFTWSGGSEADSVTISGGGGGVFFSCVEKASTGRFTVPPYVLFSIPTGSPGSLSMTSITGLARFNATGLDLATAYATFYTTAPTIIE